jgi:hydroxymethylbilane synthase
VGQGALALECRSDDAPLRALLARFEHLPTRACIEAERAFLHSLGGDCHTPLAGHARIEDNGSRLFFDGLVASISDHRIVRAGTERYIEARGADLIELARGVGRETAERLLKQGALELIQNAATTQAQRRDPRIRPN